MKKAIPFLLFSASALLCPRAESSDPKPTSAPARKEPVSFLKRPDIPEWWKRTRAFYCPFANSGAGASLLKYPSPYLKEKLKSFEDLDLLLTEARRLGTDVIYLVDYWQPGYEYKGDYELYEELGGREAFRKGIEKIHRAGGRVILYLEAFIISRRSKLGRKVGPKWAMMNADGSYQSYYHTGDRFYQMYPGPGSGWTGYLSGLAGRMARDFGIDGVHLDSYGLQWGWKDYNPLHPQGRDPESFNRGAVELVKRTRSALRRSRPDAVVILEGAERVPLLDICDGAQIESLDVLRRKPWSSRRAYPIFTSSFDLSEMLEILEAGYNLALSPWWFQAHPSDRDRRLLRRETDKRNFKRQLAALNRWGNILKANGIPLPVDIRPEALEPGIIKELNRRKWRGSFVYEPLRRAFRALEETYERNRSRLRKTPEDVLRKAVLAASSVKPQPSKEMPHCLPPPGQGDSSFRSLLLSKVPRKDVEWLKNKTKDLLRGCRIRSRDGLMLHTPDGSGHYRALWTRDFCYMVEYAGDLLDSGEVKRSIRYLLRGQREDGCIPDRVDASGRAIYSPGGNPPLADHALDNAAFLAKLAASYVYRTGDLHFFREIEPSLRKGLDHVRRSELGLVYNPPDSPQCPYGFTDTVAKTGNLLFSSLLYREACLKLEDLCRRARAGERTEYRKCAQLIRKNLGRLWDEKSGMFFAADRDCRQIDVWGSALAVALDCATPQQADRIASYLVRNYDEIFQRGQIRHLPGGEYWERLLIPIRPGTYQNGAFWAVPLVWTAPVIARKDPRLAVRTVKDAIADFRKHGVMECVNGSYHNVPRYVASATNVYGLFREPCGGFRPFR